MPCKLRAALGRFACGFAASAVLCAASVPAHAAGDCDAAAAHAEQSSDLPQRLLQSIERVESKGQSLAVDVDGTPYGFTAEADAISFVQAQRAAGARFIDVGCFQIDLRYHPEAFADLRDAFDASANARYAAHFLAALRHSTGDLGMAVAAYHSSDPAVGGPYLERVFTQWASDAVHTATWAWPQRWSTTPQVISPGMDGPHVPGLPPVFVP